MAYLATEIVVDAFEVEVPAGHWSDAVAQALSRLHSKHPSANVINQAYEHIGEGVYRVHFDFDVTICGVGQTHAEAHTARDLQFAKSGFFSPCIMIGETEWFRQEDIER